jgi:hypothetical protein
MWLKDLYAFVFCHAVMVILGLPKDPESCQNKEVTVDR